MIFTLLLNNWCPGGLVLQLQLSAETNIFGKIIEPDPRPVKQATTTVLDLKGLNQQGSIKTLRFSCFHKKKLLSETRVYVRVFSFYFLQQDAPSPT